MADLDAPTLAALAARLDALEAENSDLRLRLAAVEGTAPTAGRADEPGAPTEASVGRRSLLTKGLAVAGAAAAGAVVAGGQPAAAADGQSLFLGRSNASNATTSLAVGATTQQRANGLEVFDSGIGNADAHAAIAVSARNSRFSTGLFAGASFTGIEASATVQAIKASSSNWGMDVFGGAKGMQVQSTDGDAVTARTVNGSTAIFAQSERTTTGDAIGVYGRGRTGVRAESFRTGGTGLEAIASNGFGGTATATVGSGFRGRGTIYGVVGQSTTANPEESAVYGSAIAGRIYAGATDTGDCMWLSTASGGGVHVNAARYHLRLTSEEARSAPTGDTFRHERGEIVETSAGDLWLCTGAGTPGTWRKLAGPATAGALHVLDTPVRAYDSRPGGAPTTVGPKTPLPAGNVARTIDLKAGGTRVPAGAIAVMVNLLLTQAAPGNGNLTVWAAGAAKPQSNTLVWGGTSGRFSTLAVTKVDAQARCQIDASLSTNIVVDVVGYYR